MKNRGEGPARARQRAPEQESVDSDERAKCPRRARIRRYAVLTCAVAVLGLGVPAAPSFAASPYKYEAALSEKLSENAPGGAFATPRSLAFDLGGNLFVSDPGSQNGAAIDKFNAEGAFQTALGSGVLSQFAYGVAVNDETGHVYVADSDFSELFVLGASGELLSQWTGVGTPAKTFGGGCCFVQVATDNSSSAAKGAVYVMTTQNGGEVDVLEPQGEDKEEGIYLRSLEVPPEGFAFDGQGRDDLAVSDSSGAEAGEVYVVNGGHNTVDRFGADGKFRAAIKGPVPGEPFAKPLAVAVDPASGNVFVSDIDSGASVIDEFDHFGALVGQIEEVGGGGSLGQPLGLAIQRSGEHKGYLYASDAEGKVIDVFAPAGPFAPQVLSASVAQVSADGASFGAEIVPNGEASEYRVEYGPCATPSSCAESPYPLSTPERSLGAESFVGHSAQPIHVQGLTPETTYHFRVVASNNHGRATGEERTFTTQSLGGGLALPDGRQWELVSPVEKRGSLILPIRETGVVQAAAGGGGITYRANAPTEAEPQGYVAGAQVLSLRGPKGWASQNLAAPNEESPGGAVGLGAEYRFFSEDLAESFVQPPGPFAPSISPEASEQTVFLRSDYLNGNPEEPCLPVKAECFRPLVTGKTGFANVPAGTEFAPSGFGGPEFLGASADEEHAVLRSPTAALTESPATPESLYEWSAEAPPAGQLKLLSVLPNEQPAEEPKLGYRDHDARGAISASGSQVVFEAGVQEQEEALYLRDTEHEKTIQLDTAEGKCLTEGECESGGGRFQLASSDGSEVLFTDTRRLTANAGHGAGKADLYRCEIVRAPGGGPECQLTDLTPESGGESADVQGSVIGAAEDGDFIYFVANGVQASNADSHGERAVAGGCRGEAVHSPPDAQCNLYVHRGAETKLVAVLSGEDIHDWAEELRGMPARVSPNGQWLELMSQRSLTGYDNRDAKSGAPDAEVYLYSAASGRVTCASCEPSGARPTGVEYFKLEPGSGGLVGGPRGTWESAALVAANVPGWTGNADTGFVARHQPRYLSDEGRLFFNSADGLVPQDVNATQDVYQFEPAGIPEPPGAPGCASASPGFSAASGGCVNLISSGESSQESAFLDASESGGDVFFLTSSQLTSADKDTSRDVYDAHQCTAAAPCLAAAAAEPPPCDTGDSCKAAPSAQPEVFGVPASALFSGAGNIPPPGPAAAVKVPTKAERLAKALQSCKKRFPKSKKRRGSCEQSARKQLGAKKASAKKSTARKKGSSKGSAKRPAKRSSRDSFSHKQSQDQAGRR